MARWQRHARCCAGRVLVVASCLLLAAGCSARKASPTTRPLDKVSLQLQWVTQAQFAGYYVALEKGWYSEEGISLTILPGGPDVTPVDLVSSGTRDFATTLLADLIVAIQKGKPVVGIAQIQQENGLILVAKKSAGIDSPQAFAGKKVGVWLGSWEAQFDALMAKVGLTNSQFELVSQGWSMDPFLKGELDVASAMTYNEYQVILEQGIKPEELTIIDYGDYGLAFPGDVLLTSRLLAEQNPDLCVRMVRASLRGWQYALENPDEAAEIVLQYDETGIQTRQHQQSMMREMAKLVRTNGRPLGYSDQGALQSVIDVLLQYNVLGGAVKAQDVWNDSFWQQATK
jgi:NitT/TauT family transport system substrate-binding protein